MKRLIRRPVVLYGAMAALALIFAMQFFGGGDGPEKLTLTEFNTAIDEGRVVTAEIKDRDSAVVGELVDETEYKVSFPDELADELTLRLGEAEPSIDVEVDQQSESIWVSLLFSLLPILLLVGIFFFFINSMQGGGSKVMQFGKAKARQVDTNEPSVTFDDVAGCDEAIEELTEIKDFLQNPAKFHAIGAKIPKGVLLFGPPGTGKTLLARAVAGEAGAPFFSISGSDFVEMFVGVGASRVRDLFEQAKAQAPSIIFVDEIDAVGRHRGAGLGGGHDEREQTLNQLLVEMDGFDARAGVILIAATNRPDILDPALLRPGRFDRQIVVDHPDLAGRRAILEVHAKGKPIVDEIDLEVLAKRTPGFTGADLANLMNEAALLGARRGHDHIEMTDLTEAIDRVIAGPERRSRVMTDKEKALIAFHEAGHALVGHVLPDGDKVHKVSIVARGRALGLTWFLPEDRNTHTTAELEAKMASAMGGRTAEEVVFGEITTGAANDIEQVTEIARAMVTQYGMSDRVGPRQLGSGSSEVFLGKEYGHEANYSDEIAALIDREMDRFIDRAHETARAILTTHRDMLDLLANTLIERETLDQDELDAVWAGIDPWNPPAEPVAPIDEPDVAPVEVEPDVERVPVHAVVSEPERGKPVRWWRRRSLRARPSNP